MMILVIIREFGVWHSCGVRQHGRGLVTRLSIQATPPQTPDLHGFFIPLKQSVIKNLDNYVSEITSASSEVGIQDFKLRPRKKMSVLKARFVDVGLPAEIADILYQQHDGQDYGGLKLFGEFAMLPAGESFEIHGEMVANFADYEMDGSLCPDDRIRGDTIWRKNWYPFAWDQNNNDHMCLDYDPTENGTAGQVIYCPKEWGPLTWHATDFVEFLQTYFEKLKNVNFVLDDGPFREFDCRVKPFDS